MKKPLIICLFTLLICLFSCHGIKKQDDQKNLFIRTTMDKVIAQVDRQLAGLKDSAMFPGSFVNGNTSLKPVQDWTSGFFPGTLWYLYKYTGEEKWKLSAKKWTEMLASDQYLTNTHDLGFMIFCSYGNGIKYGMQTDYAPVILQASKSLCTRFNPKVGCIKSWDSKDQYLVIIDNMMNLEMLFWASKYSSDPGFYKIAVSHAETTLKNHFRPDFSSYHVVNYDTASGKVIWKHTAQGYSDSSLWARGQSWALYGFIVMYRETKDKRYLDQAMHIADLLISYQTMPDNGIPFWDYSDPSIPNTTRDVSAACIMASALFELCNYTEALSSGKYYAFAEKILHSLSSDAYMAKPGTNGNFILLHSVSSKPANSQVDVPLNYADYYFIEALLRFKDASPPK
jgi:unsaturated chondroitin disaccharide hydrolase